ncbi:MAG: hypothetical protein E7612_05385 [Ruminococcaceae bacterium]|nr:hypothetical protein [Oscillospiraceae bacterium]
MHKKLSKIFYVMVHVLEYLIASLTLIVLVGLLGFEIYKMFTVDGYFTSADTYLHNILTIVVGLEFVRMLINLTPANTLEVLIVAIARQVIVSHESSLSNIACVLCIGGLFAIRKFLISKTDFKKELSEDTLPEEVKEEKVSF